jgi:hypothetical protein
MLQTLYLYGLKITNLYIGTKARNISINFFTSDNIVLMMEVVRTSETSVNFYETTRRNIPEDKSSSMHG